MSAEPQLFEYGILTEASDIRAHVGILARTIYVFKTAEARELILADQNRYPLKPAGQDGVTGRTALGWCVPVVHIPNLRRLRYHSYDWTVFSPEDNTTQKGAKAVAVVVDLLRMGRFPLWVDAAESKDTSIQILHQTDLVVFHKTRIQVKCDWRSGDGEGCTGNLFLQKSERNPLKRI